MSATPGQSTKGADEVADPTQTDPDKYRVVFENDRVRVLEYRDEPGQQTSPHDHPDSVMVTLSAFRREVSSGGRTAHVDLPAGQARWVGAQEHTGHNTGDTDTHTIFVELKEPNPQTQDGPAVLGPS